MTTVDLLMIPDTECAHYAHHPNPHGEPKTSTLVLVLDEDFMRAYRDSQPKKED